MAYASEFDGSFLKSLSLDDSETFVHEEEDDLMEIDYFDDPTNIHDLTVPNVQEDKPQYLEVEESSGTVSILSPTLMGASLAVKKPKLLMPPPSPERAQQSHEFDYEFDTQQYQPRQLRQRNTSLFQTRDLGQFLSHQDPRAPPAAVPTASAFQPVNRPYTPNVFNSHNPFPFSMSHTPPSGMSYTFTMHNNVPNPHIETTDLLGKSSTIHEDHPDTQIVAASSESSLQQELQPILPPPWQSNITPIQRLPYIMWSYLQLLSNAVITGYLIYTGYTVVQSIHHDIQLQHEIHRSNMMIDIQTCRRAYNDNNCHPSTIVPVLEKQCQYWEKCMNQPIDGNISIIAAKIIGTIINNLIEPLGVKTFVYFLTTITVLYVTNFSFGYVRAKSYYGSIAQ